MKKRLKLTALLVTLIMLLTSFNLYAVPQNKIEVDNLFCESINKVSKDLPINPTVKGYILDKDGNKKNVKYKAEHKLISKKQIGDETIYSIVSDVDVAVKIKKTKSKNILASFFDNEVYALDAQDGDDYNVIHNRYRLYWDYHTIDGKKYIRYTSMEGYWTRDQVRYTVLYAKFGAYIDGKTEEQQPYYNGYYSDQFNPEFSLNSGLATQTYYDFGSYTSWPYVYPYNAMADARGDLTSKIYDSSSYVATLYCSVCPGYF